MSRRLLLLFAAAPFVAFHFAAGCAAQGEGELCSQLNNINDDCQAGLLCTQKNGYYACCPPSGSTNPACTGAGVTTATTTSTTSSTASSSTTSSTSSSTTTSSTTSTSTGDAGADGSTGDGG